MSVNIREKLLNYAAEQKLSTEEMQVPDIIVDETRIRVIMINEVPPADPKNYFYSQEQEPEDLLTLLEMFDNAGIKVSSMEDILKLGIYVTTAVKTPKEEYIVAPRAMKSQLPLLEYEISLFPNHEIVMLMGDVAKKAYNMSARKKSGKNAVPAGSTYKIRTEEIYYEGKRIFPSYVLTGKSIRLEKTKFLMVVEDLKKMKELIQPKQ